MWSAGNEIRDSLSTRTPLLTRMVSIAHALDPGRPVTQALFRPADSGDVTGATRTILDVFGGNYRPDEVIQAMRHVAGAARACSPRWAPTPRRGRRCGTTRASPACSSGPARPTSARPTGCGRVVEPDFGLMDAVGTVRPIGYSWQRTWGAPTTSPPPTGTTASRVLLAPDQNTVSTDVNDVSYVKATVADSVRPGGDRLLGADHVQHQRSGRDRGGRQRQPGAGELPRHRAQGLPGRSRTPWCGRPARAPSR